MANISTKIKKGWSKTTSSVGKMAIFTMFLFNLMLFGGFVFLSLTQTDMSDTFMIIGVVGISLLQIINTLRWWPFSKNGEDTGSEKTPLNPPPEEDNTSTQNSETT